MSARDGTRLAAFEARVARPRQVLAVAWIPLLVGSRTLQTGWAGAALDIASGIVWLFFGCEYLWRLRLAPARGSYFRSHVFDLVALLLPPLRALWGLTPFRDVVSRPGLAAFLVWMLVVTLVAAALVFAIERHVDGANIDSFGDGLWWAFVTVTTIGYGDHTPVSGLGRSVASALVLVGVALFSVVTAHITAYVLERSRVDGSAAALVQFADRLAALESTLQSIDDRLRARTVPEQRPGDDDFAGHP